MAWKSTDGTTHAGVVTFHRLGETSTRVITQIDWQPEGVAEKAGSLRGFDDRQVKSELERFKHFLSGLSQRSNRKLHLVAEDVLATTIDDVLALDRSGRRHDHAGHRADGATRAQPS